MKAPPRPARLATVLGAGWLAVVLAACAAPPTPVGDGAGGLADTVRADWGAAFERRGLVGTFVLYEPEGEGGAGRTSRYDPDRAAERFSPASTSKVFNGLVFLDRGVVTDPDSLFAWDGTQRSIAAWNRDHSLRTGTTVSAVWLFQRLALRVGRDGYAAVFARQPYGNSALSDSLARSWLDGTWRVSADEQVAFFDALRRGALAFSAEDQATVRDLLPVLADEGGATLRAKTGLGLPPGEPPIGWLVGWVERPGGDAVFALNAGPAGPDAADLGPARLAIAREVLGGEGLLPRPAP